jgi:hypothetical protein
MLFFAMLREMVDLKRLSVIPFFSLNGKFLN